MDKIEIKNLVRVPVYKCAICPQCGCVLECQDKNVIEKTFINAINENNDKGIRHKCNNCGYECELNIAYPQFLGHRFEEYEEDEFEIEETFNVKTQN